MRDCFQTGERGEVADAQRSTVEAVQVPGDASGVSQAGSEPGNAGEPVRSLVSVEGAAGVGQERRGEDGPESRHAEQERDVLMLREVGEDRGIDSEDPRRSGWSSRRVSSRVPPRRCRQA